MLVKSKNLSLDAKVIIFPSSRKLYPKELPLLKGKLDDFCSEFRDIKIANEIEYGRFVIFFIDEETALDLDGQNALIDFVISLEQEYDVSLLDKVNVCFKQGEFVQLKEVPDFKKLIKNKGVSKKTIVFDNMINTKYEFEEAWEVPAGESWLSHFF